MSERDWFSLMAGANYCNERVDVPGDRNRCYCDRRLTRLARWAGDAI